MIPYYNHGSFLPSVVERIRAFNLPLIIVDDGSAAMHKEIAEEVARDHEEIELLRHESNRGKGAAVVTAIQRAHMIGYKHVFQIDADGQHDIEKLPLFLRALKSNQRSFILAHPLYGPDAPWERVWFRKISTVLAWLQTGSRAIKDGMIGFRSYPVAETLELHAARPLAPRMGFDIEIAIRLVRKGVKPISLPLAVQYRPDGVSHYRYVRDNIDLVKVHMTLLRESFSSSLFRFRCTSSTVQTQNWFSQKESGSGWGFRLLFALLKRGNIALLKPLLHLIVLYYRLTNNLAGNSSHAFLKRVSEHTGVRRLSVHTHFMNYALSIIQGVLAWHKVKVLPPPVNPKWLALRSRLENDEGGVILSAHFGSLEVARAHCSLVPDLKIKPVMYLNNSRTFRDFQQSVNPEAAADILCVDAITPATIIELSQFIKEGGYIALLADRIPPPSGGGSSERTVSTTFFGEKVTLPLGPFLLARLLEADVLSLFTYLGDDDLPQIDFREISPPGGTARKDIIPTLVTAYTKHLESMCCQHPYQWFNFFDFFKDLQANASLTDSTAQPIPSSKKQSQERISATSS